MSTKTKKKTTGRKATAKKAAKKTITRKASTKAVKKAAKKAPAKKASTKAVKKTTAKAAQKATVKTKSKATSKIAKKKTVKPAKKTVKVAKKTVKTASKTTKQTSAKATKKTSKTSAKVAQKTTAKVAKKTVKAAKKTPVKTTPKKPLKTAEKKTTKEAVKKAVTEKKAVKKSSSKKSIDPSAEQIEVEEKTKAIVLNARKRTVTPALFKSGKNKNTPVVFTMDDVKTIIDQREKTKAKDEAEAKKSSKVAKTKQAAKKTIIDQDLPVEHRNHTAASITDILGFNPAEKANPMNQDDKVPKKFMKYYKALLQLRDHVSSELDLHTADTLKRSNKDDSGDLSGYGQHMADAGTDTFDRDFALSLVSNEQEALYEIEEAIQRIFSGNYGVCEITNEPINKERLEAVPFTRYSLEGQKELERNNRGKVKRTVSGNVFGDANDETVNFGGDIEDN